MNIGLSLGSTGFHLARIDHDGHAVPVPDHLEPSVFDTPSVVCACGSAILVGRAAEELIEYEPGVKASRHFTDHLGDPQPLIHDEDRTPWNAEAIAALTMKKLRLDAESSTPSALERTVIAVPAHFDHLQKRSVLAAAVLADLPAPRLIEEPVAIALHYGMARSSTDRIVTVFDWGGRTLAVSVLSIDRNGLHVLASNRLMCGGADIDRELGAIILEQFGRALGASLTVTARVAREIERASEAIKIDLSSTDHCLLRRPLIIGGRAVEIVLTQGEFESSITEFAAKAEAATLQCIADAGVQLRDVDLLLLAGGCSMLPGVSGRMERIFSDVGKLTMLRQPRSASALGAAIAAIQRLGEADEYPSSLSEEVRGAEIGILTAHPQSGNPTVDTLITQDMPLPARATKTYYGRDQRQREIVLEVVRRTDRDAAPDKLGELVIGPLPAARPNYTIEVTVEQGEDGSVQVRAYDGCTGVETAQTFTGGSAENAASMSARRARVRATVVNRN
jgi:molecular chaperone DnaK (HSP70)